MAVLDLVKRSELSAPLTVVQHDANLSAIEDAVNVFPAILSLDTTGVTSASAAINTALAAGKIYRLPAGTYLLTAALTPITGSGLVAEPGTVTLKRGYAGHMITLLAGSADLTDVTFRGLIFDGVVATYATTSHHTIFANSPAHAIKRLTIADCYIKDTAGAGILLTSTVAGNETITIVNNRFSNIGYQAINLQGTSYTDGDATFKGFVDTLIDHNRVIDFSMKAVDAPAITISRGGHSHIVTNNIIRAANAPFTGTVSAHGISIEGRYFTVAGNVINNLVGYGVEVGFADWGTVSGNTIILGTRAAIACTGFETGGEFCRGVTISGNTCHLNGSGIVALINTAGGLDTDDTTVYHQNIAISNNVVTSCASGTGIHVYSTKGVSVSCNMVSDCVASGIIVGYPGTTTALKHRCCENVLLSDNAAFGNNTSANAAAAGIIMYTDSSRAGSANGSGYLLNVGYNNGVADQRTYVDGAIAALPGLGAVRWGSNIQAVRPLLEFGNAAVPSGGANITANIIRGLRTIDFSFAVAASAATTTLDLANGSYQVITLSANTTMASPGNAIVGQYVTLDFIQDATGGRTVAWNSAWKISPAWSDTGNTTAKRTTIKFMVKASGFLQQESPQAPYA